MVSLDEADDKALRPNLRVDVFLILERLEGVLRLKNGPAISGGLQQDVFVLDDKGRAVKRRVGVGRNNGDFVEITAGLQEGERVIISDVQDFR
ncbi:hypothetical protein RZS08_53595, partial [Arthrospira platensis SPKY1]|nr:hypothetical protein [Arthrospira platensis SPKY1]